MAACKSCIFWEPVSDNHGKCRVNPPRAELIPVQGVAGPSLNVVTFYPETKPDDWCGAGNPGAEQAIPSSILKTD